MPFLGSSLKLRKILGPLVNIVLFGPFHTQRKMDDLEALHFSKDWKCSSF